MIFIKDNIKKIDNNEKNILLNKIRANEICEENLEIVRRCLEVDLNYDCIQFLLSIDNYDLKDRIISDLKYDLKLSEVKDILDRTKAKNIENTNDIYNSYKYEKEKYLIEKRLR